jgi:putative flippase GtrA
MKMSSACPQPETGPAAALGARFQALPQVLRYLLIGGAASALDVVLFLILFNLVGTSALVAHSISVPSSVLFSFLTNARHNFRTNDLMALRLLSFATVCTLGYATGFAVIRSAAELGLGANIGKFASLPVVFIIQYLLNSRITFRKPLARARSCRSPSWQLQFS